MRRRPARAGRGARKSSRSTALQTEVSKKTPRFPAKHAARLPRSAIPAWAMISCAPGCASTSLRSSAAIGGSPRPPWIRIGTFRSAAIAKIGDSLSSFSWKRCARGWSLIPRAPRSRHRRASSSGSSVRSSRTKGTSRPFDRSANASVRSFAARKPGWRSGSSRQNMFARDTP